MLYIHPRLDSRIEPKFSDCCNKLRYDTFQNQIKKKALMRRLVCAFDVHNTQKTGFLTSWPIYANSEDTGEQTCLSLY